jgi:hypothetical protein
MAESASEYHRGEMNITEQTRTFDLFNGLTKWGSLTIASLLTLLVFWFCTGVGFVGAAGSALVLFVLGVVFLRDKPQEAH